MATRRGCEMALNTGLRTYALVGLRSALGGHQQVAAVSSLSKIGNRDVVGFGLNGSPMYYDKPEFPMPAIRFKENTPDIMALREKEKGDWSKLTLEEKKALYRASFCQTYAEMNAPTGEWKSVIGLTLMITTACVWLFILMKETVYDPIPDTFSEKKLQAQLKRMIDLRVNPVQGIASKWDYEKGDWK